MNFKNEYKICETCNHEFTPTRSDQKFCTLKCKNRYHNHFKRIEKLDYELITKNANTILWKNRGVLLLYQGEEIELSTLEAEGFRKNYITKFHIFSERENVFYCYDMKYTFINPTKIKILENE